MSMLVRGLFSLSMLMYSVYGLDDGRLKVSTLRRFIVPSAGVEKLAKADPDADVDDDADATANAPPVAASIAPQTAPATTAAAAPPPTGEPRWKQIKATVMFAAIIAVLVAIVLVFIAIPVLVHLDRGGVDEGSAIPGATVESGEEYAKENSIGYDKGEGRWVGLWDSPDDFDTFAADKAGSGMAAFFVIHRHLVVVSAIMCVLAVPMMAYCSMGDETRSDGLQVYTLSNVDRISRHNAEDVGETFPRYLLFNFAADGTGEGVTTGLGLNEAVASLIIFFWAAWAIRFVLPALDNIADASLQDWSVFITDLPPTLEGEKHAKYKEEITELCERTVQAMRILCSVETELPVKVAQVELVRSLDMKPFKKLASLKEDKQVEVEKHRTAHAEAIQAKIDELEAELAKEAKDPETAEVVHAFVTMHRQGDTDLLLKCYKDGAFPKFHDRDVVVKQAPGPEDNIWANLDTSYKTHVFLHAMALLIQVILVVLIWWALVKLVALQKGGPEVECADEGGEVPETYTLEAAIAAPKLTKCDCAGLGAPVIKKTPELHHKCDEYMTSFVTMKYFGLLLVIGSAAVEGAGTGAFEALGNIAMPYTTSQLMLNCFGTILMLGLITKIFLIPATTSKAFGGEDGEYMFFTPNWFQNIGDIFSFQMQLMLVATVIANLVKSFIIPLCTPLIIGLFSHQAMANQIAYIRFPHESHERHAKFFVAFLGCVIISAGMPILIYCFFIFVIFSWFAERAFFARVCKQKGTYLDCRLMKKFLQLIMLTAVARCFLSAWILGSPRLFPSHPLPIVTSTGRWGCAVEMPPGGHGAWNTTTLSALNNKEYTCLRLMNTAAFPATVAFGFIAFIFIIYILALPFTDLLGGSEPPTEDDEEVFDREKLEADAEIGGYEPQSHPEDGELYQVMKDFYDQRKGDAGGAGGDEG